MNDGEVMAVARASTVLKRNGYSRAGAQLDCILDHETKGWPLGDDPEVWVLDVSAEGPEPGDYEGWQSVHAGQDGALARLVEKLVEYGLGNVEPLGSATADNGSMAGDYEVDGVSVSYGLHRMTVEP